MSSMEFNQIKTYTGVPFEHALHQMQQVLPPEAYKKVSGAGPDLTDISPAYLTEKVTQIFGPCGIGWFYQLDRADQRVQWVERTRAGGGTYEIWEASVDMLQLFYRFYDGEDNLNVSEAVISNGYSDNKNRGYALRGAITNAIGAGFAKLLWQLPVYKGIVDHKNAYQHKVGSIPAAAIAARTEASNGSSKGPKSSRSMAKTRARTASKASPVKPAAVANKAPAAGPLQRAQDYVIPDGHSIKKHRGFRLGGPAGDTPGLTPAAIAYYAKNWDPSPDDEIGKTIVQYAGMIASAA